MLVQVIQVLYFLLNLNWHLTSLLSSVTHILLTDNIEKLKQQLLLHPFNGLFSRRTWVRRQQKGKPFWILLEQEMMGWQWHQLDHMQIICTSLHTDNHASTSPLSFYKPDALPVTQPTASKYWRQRKIKQICDLHAIISQQNNTTN